jgi:hypothetical protein
MKCSRTDVLRKAMRELELARSERRLKAQAFLDRLFSDVPSDATLMVGLDDALEPYATLNGNVRRPDIAVVGDRLSIRGETYIRVLLVDAQSDLRLDAGVIKASTGGWLALIKPFPITLAT